MKAVLNLLALAALAALVFAASRAGDDQGNSFFIVDGVSLPPFSGIERRVVPEPDWTPETLRERIAAAAEACVTGWGRLLPARMRPQGGSPLDVSGEAYGCVAMDGDDAPVFAVVRYAGGDRTRPRAWSIDALCDEEGGRLLGDGALCRHSPL